MGEYVEQLKIQTDSSSLGAAADAAKALTAELEQSTSASARLRDEQGRFMSANQHATGILEGLKDIGAGAGAASEDLEEASEAASALGGADMAALTDGLSAVAAGALVVGAALGAVIYAGAEMAVSAVSFKESALVGLQAVAGTAAGAEALYAQASSLAVQTGVAKDKVLAAVNALHGFSGETIPILVQAQLDVGAAKGEAAGAAIGKILEKVGATGSFGSEAVKALAAQGVAAEGVYAALAASTGKSMAEVQAAVKAGAISAEEGSKAVAAAISSQFGGAAAQAAATFPRLMQSARTAFEALFEGIDISPLKDAIKSVVDALSGESGTKIKAALEGALGPIFSIFENVDGSTATAVFDTIAGVIERLQPITEGLAGAFREFMASFQGGDSAALDGIMGAIDAIGGAIGAALPYVGAFIGGFGSGVLDGAGDIFMLIADAIGLVTDALGGASGNGDTFKSVLRTVGSALGYVTGFLGALAGALAVVAGAAMTGVTFFGAMTAGAMALWEQTVALAGALSDLGNTIGDTLSSVASAFTEAFDSATQAVVDFATSIFTDAVAIGTSIVDGIISGIDGGAGALLSKLQSLATSALQAARDALDSHSPSQAFAALGGDVAAGLELGIDGGASRVSAAAGAMAAGALGGASAGLAARANDNAIPFAETPRAGGGGVTININIAIPPGSTPEQAAAIGQAAGGAARDELERALPSLLRRAAGGG